MGASFQTTNHILDGMQPVTSQPGNQENGGESFSGSACLSSALLNKQQRQKSAFVGANRPHNECCW